MLLPPSTRSCSGRPNFQELGRVCRAEQRQRFRTKPKLIGASGSTSGRRKSKRYKSDRTRHLSGEHREQPAWSLLKVWDRQPHPWLSEMAVSEKNSFEPVWLLFFFFRPVSSWSKERSKRVRGALKAEFNKAARRFKHHGELLCFSQDGYGPLPLSSSLFLSRPLSSTLCHCLSLSLSLSLLCVCVCVCVFQRNKDALKKKPTTRCYA